MDSQELHVTPLQQHYQKQENCDGGLFQDIWPNLSRVQSVKTLHGSRNKKEVRVNAAEDTDFPLTNNKTCSATFTNQYQTNQPRTEVKKSVSEEDSNI